MSLIKTKSHIAAQQLIQLHSSDEEEIKEEENPVKIRAGYQLEEIPDDNEITADLIEAYPVLYERLMNLVKCGVITYSFLDLGFSHLEITQILAVNGAYDYSVRAKRKPAYVKDLLHLVLNRANQIVEPFLLLNKGK
jgi:hypothetical protein